MLRQEQVLSINGGRQGSQIFYIYVNKPPDRPESPDYLSQQNTLSDLPVPHVF